MPPQQGEQAGICTWAALPLLDDLQARHLFLCEPGPQRLYLGRGNRQTLLGELCDAMLW